jgi:hypothetical protein
MSISRFSSNIEVVETFDGVRYVLRRSGSDLSNVSLGLGFILRIPLVAAGMAAWFLGQHFGQVSLFLTGLAGLFVAQMLFAARLPWILFRQHLWQQLIARFGNGEIALRGQWLLSGNRVGIFWSGQKRHVSDIHRILVYVYTDPSAPSAECRKTANGTMKDEDDPVRTVAVVDDLAAGHLTGPVPSQGESTADSRQLQAQPERAVLAIETGTRNPWLLVDGYARSEAMALAEDIHSHIAAVREHRSSQSPLPRPIVIETQAEALYPPLPPDFYRRRKPFWLGIHLAGAVGLAALTRIAIQAGVWQVSTTKFAILLGWLLELLMVLTTLSLSGTSEAESTAA